MFDCVMPTRNGRNAYAFTKARRDSPAKQPNTPAIRARSKQGCDCHACLNFTRGAIRHFFFASEMLGPMLLSLHNTRFYQRLMADVRASIEAGTFADFVAEHDPRSRLRDRGKSKA